MTTKAKKRKRATKPAKKKRPAAKPAKDLGEWRWVLAGIIVLIIVILVWGKRIP